MLIGKYSRYYYDIKITELREGSEVSADESLQELTLSSSAENEDMIHRKVAPSKLLFSFPSIATCTLPRAPSHGFAKLFLQNAALPGCPLWLVSVAIGGLALSVGDAEPEQFVPVHVDEELVAVAPLSSDRLHKEPTELLESAVESLKGIDSGTGTDVEPDTDA